jgi:hypothetical protein
MFSTVSLQIAGSAKKIYPSPTSAINLAESPTTFSPDLVHVLRLFGCWRTIFEESVLNYSLSPCGRSFSRTPSVIVDAVLS